MLSEIEDSATFLKSPVPRWSLQNSDPAKWSRQLLPGLGTMGPLGPLPDPAQRPRAWCSRAPGCPAPLPAPHAKTVDCGASQGEGEETEGDGRRWEKMGGTGRSRNISIMLFKSTRFETLCLYESIFACLLSISVVDLVDFSYTFLVFKCLKFYHNFINAHRELENP